VCEPLFDGSVTPKNVLEVFEYLPMLQCHEGKEFSAVQVGHTFTIEPMINAGAYQDVIWPDGWTAVTADGSRSAQFEHSLVITEAGCDILTARTKDSPLLWWEAEGVALDL
jgi:methionyl aminopeptidase